MKIRHLIAGLAVLALAACATPRGETPQQVVFGLKSDYRALLIPVVEYEALPRCTDKTPEVLVPGELACSDETVVELIRRADRHAFTALESASDVVRSPVATDDTIQLAIRSAETALRVLTQVLVDEGVYGEVTR